MADVVKPLDDYLMAIQSESGLQEECGVDDRIEAVLEEVEQSQSTEQEPQLACNP